MIDAIAARPQEAMRLRARSFMAFVLTPSQPISEWLAQLDKNGKVEAYRVKLKVSFKHEGAA